MVQWLRLWASNAGDTGHGTKIPHATWQKIKIKNKDIFKTTKRFFLKKGEQASGLEPSIRNLI